MTFLIAEISSNHNQSLKRIYNFIDKSSELGFDAVKFQLFKIEKLFPKEILFNSKNHRNRKKWELPISFIKKIRRHCNHRNIKFGITPFYLEDINFLKKYVDFFKIASYEINWHKLLKECSLTKKPIIVSTGMANLKEVENAIKVIKKNKNKNFSIMHCVSSYPAKVDELNLSAIETLRKKFNCKVGWSDHSKNLGVIYRAVFKWNADLVEMHIDLDKKGAEFKSGHCWLPNELEKLIPSIKLARASDGNGKKVPAKSEKNERLWRADPYDGLRPLKKIRKNFK